MEDRSTPSLPPGEQRSLPEDVARAHAQIGELLDALRGCASRWGGRAQRAASLRQEIGRRLVDLQGRVEDEWSRTREAVSALVRTQIASGLAPAFLERRHPYKEQAELTALMRDGLLHHSTFIQKPPYLLAFYAWLLRGLEREPETLLEIGVKGGGSTAFWKAVFPHATIVGLDIKLQKGLGGGAVDDGVVYLQGDQSDVGRLREIAGQYGPFDVVIDDGSHVSAHQATTLRALLPCVRPGGYYVIEDINTSVKDPAGQSVDYGDDPWPDFTLSLLQRLRRGPQPPATPGGTLGVEVARMVDDLVLARNVLAIRVKGREQPDATTAGAT